MIPAMPNVLTYVYRAGAWVEGTPEERATGNGGQRVVMTARWVRIEQTGEMMCAVRFEWGDAAPGVDIATCMNRVHAAALWPLPPEAIVWPFPVYPVDADGRGLSVMEVEHLRRTYETPNKAAA